ncbi:MAG: hypothetical protein JWM53_3721, partial [bacterium]|nr:hypothetical protein [bacterium]
RGVSARGRLLHDGSIAGLGTLFAPGRTVAGHRFGLDLAPEDRDALLAYLAIL